MKTCLDCIPCFVRQTLDSCRMITSDEVKIRRMLEQILAFLSGADFDRPPPVIVAAIHRIIRRELGNPDPYRSLKKKSTKKALELSEKAEKMIDVHEDPFAAAVRFAIAGNILDFGAKASWDESRVLESFRVALAKPIKNDLTQLLGERLAKAKNVLVLGDNAGEAVFDRILISRFPGKPVVHYAVKGTPVINDVTEEDARDAGIHRVATIISNGTDIPGTNLIDTSGEFQALFRTADVVISKGQGNFETLNEEQREIFFILQIKCESLARRTGFESGDWIVSATQ